MTLVNKIAFPLIVTAVFLFLFCWSPLLRAADSTDRGSMRFLPFNVQQAGDFKYLQDGAANMMACRVAEKAKVDIASWSAGVDKLTTFWVSGQLDFFKQHIGESDTEYLLTGNLISRGKELRLEIFVFEVAGTALKGQFSAVASDEGEILTVMEKLSRDIAEKVFGQKELAAKEENGAGRACVVSQTPHPEKLYKDSLRSQEFASAVTSEEERLFSDENVGRGIVLDMTAKDLDVGDFDGDGRDEVVVVSNSKMQVLRYLDGEFKFLYSYDLGGGLKTYAVNLADLNGNGTMEAYISASAGDRPESRIVEWRNHEQGKFFVTTAGYYLRPMAIPGKGFVLLGQTGAVDGPLGASIYRLLPPDGNHAPRPVEMLSLPSEVNVFNFSWVDFDNNGEIEIVCIDGQNKLNVFSAGGERLWVSAEAIGRRGDYLGADLARLENAIERDLIYLPGKIVVDDINKDGRPEILVGDNLQTSPILLKHSRTFDNAMLVALSWDGSSMKQLWRSSIVKGYLAGYQYRAAVSDLEEQSDEGRTGAGLYLCKLEKSGLMGILGPSTNSKIIYYPAVFE